MRYMPRRMMAYPGGPIAGTPAYPGGPVDYTATGVGQSGRTCKKWQIPPFPPTHDGGTVEQCCTGSVPHEKCSMKWSIKYTDNGSTV